MFKLGSFEEEICNSMEKGLLKQASSNYGINKLVKAAKLLNMAADIFDNANMQEEAAEVTSVLEDLTFNDLAAK
jgi:hypothetical protein